MFAVVKYYNYRNNVSFKILDIIVDFQQALNKAKYHAINMYGIDNITNEIEDNLHCIKLSNIELDGTAIYTTKNGYDKYVFAVMKLPNITTYQTKHDLKCDEKNTDDENDKDDHTHDENCNH